MADRKLVLRKYNYLQRVQYTSYTDSLFLSVENFAEANPEEYSYEILEQGRSLLIDYEKGWQIGRSIGKHVPDLQYTYVRNRTGCMHAFLSAYLIRHLDDGEGYFEDGTTGCTAEPVEEPAWEAEAVYRMFRRGEPTNKYLVEFKDRFLVISYEDELTSDQIVAIREIIMK